MTGKVWREDERVWMEDGRNMGGDEVRMGEGKEADWVRMLGEDQGMKEGRKESIWEDGENMGRIEEYGWMMGE